MTTATLRLSTPPAKEWVTPKRKGLLARFYHALIEARMRRAAQEIAMHRHLMPDQLLKVSGDRATVTNDGALPFTR
jgi:hypothetical protein